MIEQYYREEALAFYRKNLDHAAESIPSKKKRVFLAAILVICFFVVSLPLSHCDLPHFRNVIIDCSSGQLINIPLNYHFTEQVWIKHEKVLKNISLLKGENGLYIPSNELTEPAGMFSLVCRTARELTISVLLNDQKLIRSIDSLNELNSCKTYRYRLR